MAKLLDRTTWAQHALDLLPSALEFATFSLLAMYFVYILLEQDDKWETRRTLVLVLFVTFNLFIVCLNVIVFALYLHINDARVPLWVAQIESSIESASWLTVVMVLGGAGFILVQRMRKHPTSRMWLLLPRGLSWLKLAVLVSIIVLAYLSRCAFEFVSVGTGTFYHIHSGDDTNDVVVFVLLFVWELIPLTAVLILFGSVGGGGGGGGSGGIASSGSVPSGVAPVIASINNPDSRSNSLPGMASASSEGDPILGRGSAFFKKDSRYDSDSDDDINSSTSKFEPSVGASPYRAFPTSSGSFNSVGGGGGGGLATRPRLYQSSSSIGDK